MGLLSWIRNLLVGTSAPINVTSENQTPVTSQVASVDLYQLGNSGPIATPSNSSAEPGRAITDTATVTTAQSDNHAMKVPEKLTAAERAALVDRKVAELEGELIFSKVAGVTKRNKSGPGRQKLLRELEGYGESWAKFTLEPEPANRYDPNAVKVIDMFGDQLGYVNERMAAEMARSRAKGDQWECYFVEITGGYEPGISFGCNIALLRWNPGFVARPHGDFERLMSSYAARVGGRWFYAKVIGLTKKNEDGTERSKLYGSLAYMDQLTLTTDGDTPATSKYLFLRNDAGERLGSLNLTQSTEVLKDWAEGCKWSAFFRECEEQEAALGFRPHIALLCCGAEWSRKN